MEDDDHSNLIHDQTRMPLTNIHRLMRRGIPSYGKASKEAKQTVQDALQEFISFVTSEAKSICNSDRRKVLGTEDILRALETLGMKTYSDVLKEYQKSFRKSVVGVPMGSDGEPEKLPDAGSNENEMTSPGSTGLIGHERPDGLHSESLSEIHKSLGVPPITKTIPDNSKNVENFPSVVTGLHSDLEDNSGANSDEHVHNFCNSRAIMERKQTDDICLAPVVHRNVTVPAWTIPTTFIAGIKVPPIDIPKLCVPVEVPIDIGQEHTAGQPAPVMIGHLEQPMSSIGEELTARKSATLDDIEPAPNTEVIDLVTPTSHIPLELLDPDTLDPFDFGALLDKTGTRNVSRNQSFLS